MNLVENKKIEYWKSQLLDTGKRNKSTDIRNRKLACLSKESLYICPVLKEQK